MSDGLELYAVIRKASPGIVVNNLVAKREEFELDYVTQEQEHFADAFPRHLEACYTLKESWGYKKQTVNGRARRRFTTS